MVIAATPSPCILWSCIARNDIVLAEAGKDPYGGIVTQTAKELLNRAPTPGYEFHTVKQPTVFTKLFSSGTNSTGGGGTGTTTTTSTSKSEVPHSGSSIPTVRGIKFHVYERLEVDDLEYNHMCDEKNLNEKSKDTFDNLRIWVFAVVYDTTIITQKEIQIYLDKLVELTIILRETDPIWKECDVLGLQNTFAPILQHQMEFVVPRDPKIIAMEEQLTLSKELMNRNIELILSRGEQLDELAKDASHLEEMSKLFQKRTKEVKRLSMLQNAKHGVVLGTAVSITVGIFVVPPLVALV